MPLDPEFLELLVCPSTRRPLRLATPAELAALNARIRAGGVVDRGGEAVAEPLEGPQDGGLVPDGEAVLYPVREDIPKLLVEAAIPLADSAGSSAPAASSAPSADS